MSNKNKLHNRCMRMSDVDKSVLHKQLHIILLYDIIKT